VRVYPCRLLAYEPYGTPLSNGVTCTLTFSALPEARDGLARLESVTHYFVDDSGNALSGRVYPGVLLIGDAIGFWTNGLRVQFRGQTGSDYVIQTSTNLTTWTALLTSTAADGLVTMTETNMLASPRRFFRAVR